VVGVRLAAVGTVQDSALTPGTWRPLDLTEVRSLYGDGDMPDATHDVIAIDGPGGVGKTTTSRAIAAATGRAHLDTGAMYRAATLAVLQQGVDAEDAITVTAVVAAADIGYEDGRTFLNGEDVSAAIRTDEVDGAVSAVSAVAEVRSRMGALQRLWVERHGPSVVEGRDIGTVVFSESQRKVFLTADPEVRAARRATDEAATAGEAVAEQLARRDRLDSSREVSPLRPAADAVIIDTSELTPQEVVARVLAADSEAGAGS